MHSEVIMLTRFVKDGWMDGWMDGQTEDGCMVDKPINHIIFTKVKMIWLIYVKGSLKDAFTLIINFKTQR